VELAREASHDWPLDSRVEVEIMAPARRSQSESLRSFSLKVGTSKSPRVVALRRWKCREGVVVPERWPGPCVCGV
jgi:hypothetical protein